MNFKLIKQDGEARLGQIQTQNGLVETPSYVVVGTNGYIRTLEPEDIPKTGTQIIISNTYHLWQTLGEEGLNEFPGLHSFMGWDGLIMTDSGGFQVFSLGAARETNSGKVADKAHRQNPSATREHGEPSSRRMTATERKPSSRRMTATERKPSSRRMTASQVRVTDSGVYFTLPDSPEEAYLDAELSMRIQEQLGADIILAFDEPSSPNHDRAYTEKSMTRTHAWAKRSLEAKTSNQKIYGIIQGGHFEDLRKESAEFIGSLPFDGFAIGGSFGSSFGSAKTNTFQEISWTTPFLPPEKPRHLLGIGRIEDIFEAVERGVDTMDCVIPTREARHGGIWSQNGRIDILKGKFITDETPLIENCACPTCAEEGVTKAKLCALFKEKNPEAGRLATIHNIFFFNDLMRQIREAIQSGQFQKFKQSYIKIG